LGALGKNSRLGDGSVWRPGRYAILLEFLAMELRPGKDVPAFDSSWPRGWAPTRSVERHYSACKTGAGSSMVGQAPDLHCWVKIGKVEAWEWLRDGDLPIPEDLEEPDPWGLEWSGRA